MDMKQVDLQNLVGGALQEKFIKSFERVIDNLQDQNTSFKTKRGITIKMTFDQNENRDDVSVSIDVQEKLAPQSGMKTSFFIGKDIITGEVYAEEYGKQIRGQMALKDYEAKTIQTQTQPQETVQKIGGDVVDTSTGEILSEEEAYQGETVVDFRKAAF